ncbi:MAG: hypothetical protein AB1758_13680, partial [Candidatus Eremiobacterota bacterium]
TPPPTQETQTTLASRVSELIRTGKHSEAARLVESGYYQRVLTRLAGATGEGTQAIAEVARQGLEIYRLDGDPVEMSKVMREALQTVAEGPDGPAAARRYQEVARMALQVGDTLGQANYANQGLFGQIRAEGLKKGLEQVLTLPQRVDENASGLPRDLVRAYLDALTDTAQLALDAGKDYEDPGVQAVIYQTTLEEVAAKVRQDGDFLGSEVQRLLELISALTRR